MERKSNEYLFLRFQDVLTLFMHNTSRSQEKMSINVKKILLIVESLPYAP